jgi:hypothetical protein
MKYSICTNRDAKGNPRVRLGCGWKVRISDLSEMVNTCPECGSLTMSGDFTSTEVDLAGVGPKA